MKSTTNLLAVVFLFTFTAGIAFAQQEAIVPQYQHLRGLEPFTG